MVNYQNYTHEGVIFVYIWWFLLNENVGYWLSKLDILFCGTPVQHLNECNFDNYQFFPLTTFLGEIIGLYLQTSNFLENLMPILKNLNKETKNKASMLKIDESCNFHSSLRGVCRTRLSI